MDLPELLIPVGSPGLLPAALAFGADAVYCGSSALSLRAKADNFSDDALREALAYTHSRGKKLYLTVNIFAHQQDLPGAEDLFRKIAVWPERPDAFIVSDPGIFRLAQRLCPSVPLHISTQANTTNAESAAFWGGLGASRIVCAREMTLEEIAETARRLPDGPELEVFVHGSMCMSYSGRCLISSFLTGRDANRGLCTQPCRWQYYLCEETRPGEYMPLEETERGIYLYNSRDLCMISHLPELLAAGVRSLKVEGRMKNELYIAAVTRAYRKALDALAESEEAYRAVLPWCEHEVYQCTTRDYCTGFFFGRPGPEAQNFESSAYRQDVRFLGRVERDAKGFYIIQKNKFMAGERIQAVRPGGDDVPLHVLYFETEEGVRRDSCPHAGEKLYLVTDVPLQQNDILREAAK